MFVFPSDTFPLNFVQPIVTMLEDVKRSFLREQATKARAQNRAASLEERLKKLEEENASLKAAAEVERSAKDRLLAVVHSLTGFFSTLVFQFCVFWLFFY